MRGDPRFSVAALPTPTMAVRSGGYTVDGFLDHVGVGGADYLQLENGTVGAGGIHGNGVGEHSVQLQAVGDPWVGDVLPEEAQELLLDLYRQLGMAKGGFSCIVGNIEAGIAIYDRKTHGTSDTVGHVRGYAFIRGKSR